jgi:hypothetical protein
MATRAGYETEGSITRESGTRFTGRAGGLAGLGVAPAGTAPVFAAFDPADGASLANADNVEFDCTIELVDSISVASVTVEFADGRNETVYDGASFTDDYSGAVTNITGGKHFNFTRTGGWRTASLLFHLFAVGGRGGTVFSSTYNLTVTDPPSEVDAIPVIDGFDPADGSAIANADTVSFDVTIDSPDSVDLIVISVEFADGRIDVIHDADGFTDDYSTSTLNAIAGGYTVEMNRDAGWRTATLAFRVIAVGGDGGLASHSTYNLTVTDPPSEAGDVTAPVISNVSPTAGSQIYKHTAISFDVADETELGFVEVQCEQANIREVVHDGLAFLYPYVASTRTGDSVAGYSYTVRRSGGWISAPTFYCKAFDGSPNEAS